MRPALVLCAGLSLACTDAGTDANPAPDAAACGRTQGGDPSLDAVEAARRCEEDPAGTHCQVDAFLTEAAARCAAGKIDPQTVWSGGLFFDRVAHRPVWRMFASLRHDQPGGHRHLLLDASSGAAVEMLAIDGRRSKMVLQTPDAEPTPLPEFSGNLLVIGDQLVGFDARAGKKFAEAFKVASRTISGSAPRVTVEASLDAEGNVRPVTFPAAVTIDDGSVHLVTTVPVDERSVSMDLHAERPDPAP